MQRLIHRSAAPRTVLGRGLGLFVVAALTCASPIFMATAQTPAAEAKALDLAKQAKKAFGEGRYQQAAMLFKQAYAQVPEPTLLFNAARAYQRGGYLHEALSVFRLYLTLATHDDPETRSGRAEAVEHVQAIEKKIAEDEAARRRATQPGGDGGGQGGATSGGPGTGTAAGGNPGGSGSGSTGSAGGSGGSGGGSSGGSGSGDDRPNGIHELPPVAQPVRRPGLFGRVHDDAWTRREVAAVALMGAGAAVCVGALIGHAVLGSDLADVEDRLAAEKLSNADGVFYPRVRQREVDAAVAAHDDARFNANLSLGIGAAVLGTGAILWLTRTTGDQVAGSLLPTVAIGNRGATLGWSLRW